MINHLYQYLGLAKRAHYLFVGEELISKASKNKISLIIIAEDASTRFVSELQQNLHNNPRIIKYKTKRELGSLIEREEVNAIGISNSNMAKAIYDTIQKGDANE